MTKKERVWFVTGISSGFGQCLAQEILSHGDILVGTFRQQSQVDDFNKSKTDKALAIKADVTNPQDIKNSIQQTLVQFGRIDVLVNNAGYGLLGAVEEVDLKDVRTLMETNFFGTLMMTQEVLPIMRKQRSGHIMQISSIAGLTSAPGAGLYNASKHALEGFSEALYHEVKPLNIKVTLVEPGPFRTNFAGSSLKTSAKIIDDYTPTAGAWKTLVNSYDGKQDGDPVKAAKVMIEAVNADEPPLRLLLGKPALDRLRIKLNWLEKDLKDWEHLTLHTSYDQ